MVLDQRTRPEASSSSDSKFSISVRKPESSTVEITSCYTCRRNCSARSETAKVSLRSLNDFHLLRICSMMGWDDDNIGTVLSPHKRKFMELIELRKKEGSSLLLRCTI